MTPDDTCDKCDCSLFDYDRVIYRCRSCDAQFCDECFELIKENNNICPECGVRAG